MTRLAKITRTDLTTYNGFRYEPGVWTPTLSGEGDLCGPDFYHAYLTPQLALLLNPIHGNYPEPFRLWWAEGEIVARDHALKVGTRRLRLVEEIAVPEVTTEQRVTFALHCALAIYLEPGFVAWAEGWLSGADRTWAAAAWAAGAEAASAAAWAAEAAARAAEAAWAAAAAARAAARAAGAEAAWAAAASAAAAADFNLPALAHAALLPWEP